MPYNGANGEVRPLFVGADGKILLGGLFTRISQSFWNKIGVLNADGTADIGFNTGPVNGVSGGTVLCSAIQADQKVVIGGSFTKYNTITQGKLARVNTDGTLDASFAPSINGDVTSVFVQPNGQIVISGAFTVVNSATRLRVARLNSDGTLDASFTADITGGTPAPLVNSIALINDGSGAIAIGGIFTFVNGQSIYNLAKVGGTTGALDATFQSNAGSGPNGEVTVVASTEPNKLMVGGLFTNYNGPAANRLLRISTTGVRDATFNPTSTNMQSVTRINSILRQSDGKLIIGGQFTAAAGSLNTSIKNLVKVRNDGTYMLYTSGANTFPTTESNFGGSNFNGQVKSMVIQPDGKLIVVGSFTVLPNGGTAPRIVRFDQYSMVDGGLTPGPGPDNALHTVAWQNDWNIVVGGAFVSISSYGKNQLARLLITAPTTTISPEFCSISGVDWTTTIIYAIPLSWAQDYEFQIIGGIVNTTVVKGSPAVDLDLNTITGMTYSTAYEVKVRVKYNGVWYNYGAGCTFTTMDEYIPPPPPPGGGGDDPPDPCDPCPRKLMDGPNETVILANSEITDVIVHPNPTRGAVSLELAFDKSKFNDGDMPEVKFEKPIRYILYDTFGTPVSVTESNQSKVDMDISNLINGMFLVRVEHQGKRQVQVERIIKIN